MPITFLLPITSRQCSPISIQSGMFSGASTVIVSPKICSFIIDLDFSVTFLRCFLSRESNIFENLSLFQDNLFTFIIFFVTWPASSESEEEASSWVAGRSSSSLCSGDIEANVMPQRISSFSLSGHDVDLFRMSKRRLSFCIYNKGKQKENYDECRISYKPYLPICPHTCYC